ncbi:zinc finger BED domain-containing protein 6-like [Hyperolius riggenbachi]|uniref:zinc finger BED domain-containing protein 6-like n=1 Tax=Hyperolius riggenbachi TaxID=752182 RepID=UPI0035A287EB
MRGRGKNEKVACGSGRGRTLAGAGAANLGKSTQGRRDNQTRSVREMFRLGQTINETRAEILTDWLTQASEATTSSQSQSQAGCLEEESNLSANVSADSADAECSDNYNRHLKIPSLESPALCKDRGEVNKTSNNENCDVCPDSQEEYFLGKDTEHVSEVEMDVSHTTGRHPAVQGPTSSRANQLCRPLVASEEEVACQVEDNQSICDVALNIEVDYESGEDSDQLYVPSNHQSDTDSDDDLQQPPRKRKQLGISHAGRKQRGKNSHRASGSGTQQAVKTHVSGQSKKGSGRKSLVWDFFSCNENDESLALCFLCRTKVKRGQLGTRLGTTALATHMVLHHRLQWEQHKNTKKSQPCNVPQPTNTIVAPLTPSSNSSLCRHAAADDDYHHSQSYTSRSYNTDHSSESPRQCQPALSSFTSRGPEIIKKNLQPSISEVLECRKPLAPNHPRVQKLNELLAKLLAVQLLPYRLVDTAAFRDLMSYAMPNWRIPSRHYFSNKAVPALYEHIARNINLSLDHAVGGRVHITTDAWTSRHGQGRYISFTAHWVTLMRSDKGAASGAPLQVVVPPRLLKRRQASGSSSSTSTSSTIIEDSASSSSISAACCTDKSGLSSKCSQTYGMMQHCRCQALLQLVCLGEKSHTGQEILTTLHSQEDKWLAPHQLKVGNVVSDNGANMVSAVRLGSLTHVPCLAHILNLIVQKFLKTYSGMSDLLNTVRKVCSHFKYSATAAASLAQMQRQHSLPPNKLIRDTATRWNSTLYMVQRLCEQHRAVRNYLLEEDSRSSASNLGYINGHQWQQLRHLCKVLAPFEEATRFVSRDKAGFNDVIPLVFMLDRTLGKLMDLAEDSEDNESGRVVSGLDEDLQQDIEEEEEAGQALGEAVVRGWEDEEEQLENVEEDENVYMSPEEEQVDKGPLFNMAAHMIRCLRQDPRIKKIKDRDDYWIATLLDPRYKEKLPEFIDPSQRKQRITQLTSLLKKKLIEAFPQPELTESHSTNTHQRAVSSSSISHGGNLMQVWRDFFQPRQVSETHGSVSSHQQRLERLVVDYMTYRSPDSIEIEDPMEFWVSRFDHSQELAEFALEVMSCPPSSVLSERAFSAAGGVVTDKRTRLSTKSVDILTCIKFNESWITEQYKTPTADSRD